MKLIFNVDKNEKHSLIIISNENLPKVKLQLITFMLLFSRSYKSKSKVI